jgi:UDP-galactopyranose mutase
MAARESKVCFVGRLASYKYFNMDQAFLNALEMFDEYFSRSSSFPTHLGEGDGPK